MVIWYFSRYCKMCIYLFIYLFHALSRNPLAGKHCIKHRHHQYIRLTGKKPWINVNGLVRRLSWMAKRRWNYILSGHSCRPVDMQIWETSTDASPNRDIQKICTNSQVKYPSSWLLCSREIMSSISENSLVWLQLRLKIRHTRIGVSSWQIPGRINASIGRQRIDICGQIQETYK